MYTTPLTYALFCILAVLHSHWGIEVRTLYNSCTLLHSHMHSSIHYIGCIGVLRYVHYNILVHYYTHRCTLLYVGCTPLTLGFWGTYTVHRTLYFSFLNVPFLPSAYFNPCHFLLRRKDEKLSMKILDENSRFVFNV